MIDWLHSPDGRFGADPIGGRDAVLGKSLDEAVAELTKRFGPDMAGVEIRTGSASTMRWCSIRLDQRRQRRDASEAGRRTIAARRRRHDGERHRQRRQPDLGRIAQDRRRHGGLG